MVVDACALIAFLNGEPGADVVEDALANVAGVEIACINLLEVAYDAVRKTGRPEAAAEVLRDVEKMLHSYGAVRMPESIKRRLKKAGMYGMPSE